MKKDYLDDLLDFYDIERTDKEGIWVKTKEGNIIPFDYNFERKCLYESVGRV